MEPDDRLKRCFKIVRVAKRAHPKGDTIVAVTYDYQVIDQKQITTDISQQIWVGSYQGKGIPIQWQELTSGLTIENLKEERVFAQDSDKVGHTEDLPPKKILGVPVERLEKFRPCYSSFCMTCWMSKINYLCILSQARN